MSEEPNVEDPIRMFRKDCGIHFGLTPGPCSKCAHESKLPKAGRMYGGNSFNAIFGPYDGRGNQLPPEKD